MSAQPSYRILLVDFGMIQSQPRGVWKKWKEKRLSLQWLYLIVYYYLPYNDLCLFCKSSGLLLTNHKLFFREQELFFAFWGILGYRLKKLDFFRFILFVGVWCWHHVRSQILRFGVEKYILGRESFCFYYMFEKTIYEHNKILGEQQNLGSTAPECPRGFGPGHRNDRSREVGYLKSRSWVIKTLNTPDVRSSAENVCFREAYPCSALYTFCSMYVVFNT